MTPATSPSAVYPGSTSRAANPALSVAMERNPVVVTGSDCAYQPFAKTQPTACGKLLDALDAGVDQLIWPSPTPDDPVPDGPGYWPHETEEEWN